MILNSKYIIYQNTLLILQYFCLNAIQRLEDRCFSIKTLNVKEFYDENKVGLGRENKVLFQKAFLKRGTASIFSTNSIRNADESF